MAGRNSVGVFLAVGSNIEPERNVRRALELLIKHVHVAATSTFYRTAPLRRPQDPPFANGIWRIETDTGPRPLKFDVLRGIEDELGRVRTADAYAPRTIDLDIAVYGEQRIEDEDLVIPDPDILERPFLAVPLLELAPDLRLPGTDRPLRQYPVSERTDELEPMRGLTEQLKETLHYERRASR
ncbi:MAG: 2-amino-4-hydroxy-6-hydroxymethyldihydropteridine diphosphokinase [Candidatus Brocadiia bacterium]